MDEQKARDILDHWIRADDLLGGDVYGRPFGDDEKDICSIGAKVFLEGFFTPDELEAVAWWLRNKKMTPWTP